MLASVWTSAFTIVLLSYNALNFSPKFVWVWTEKLTDFQPALCCYHVGRVCKCAMSPQDLLIFLSAKVTLHSDMPVYLIQIHPAFRCLTEELLICLSTEWNPWIQWHRKVTAPLSKPHDELNSVCLRTSLSLLFNMCYYSRVVVVFLLRHQTAGLVTWLGYVLCLKAKGSIVNTPEVPVTFGVVTSIMSECVCVCVYRCKLGDCRRTSRTRLRAAVLRGFYCKLQ